MVVIGCDFGLRKSGIVVLGADYEIFSQNLIKTPIKIKGAERLVYIEKAFDYILSPHQDEEIQLFIEGYAYGARYQRESLAELGGVMRRYFYLKNLDYWVVPPTSLKYFVTGVGTASKNYVKKCTKEKWNIAFKSDDVCDAYGLARIGVSTMRAYYGIEGLNHLNDSERDTVMDIFLNREQHKNGNTAKQRKNKKVNGKRKNTIKSKRHDKASDLSRSHL